MFKGYMINDIHIVRILISGLKKLPPVKVKII